jgi:hypothetical protein
MLLFSALLLTMQLNAQIFDYEFSGKPVKITPGTITNKEIECYFIGYDSVENRAYGFNSDKSKLVTYDVKNLTMNAVKELNFKEDGEKRAFKLAFTNDEGKIFFISSKIKKLVETIYAQELDKKTLTLKASFKIFEGEILDKEFSYPIFSLLPDKSALLCKTDNSEDFVVLDRNLQLLWKQALPAKKGCKLFRLVTDEQVIVPPCNTQGSVDGAGNLIFHFCTPKKIKEVKAGVEGALGYDHVSFCTLGDEIFLEGFIIFKYSTAIFKDNGKYEYFSGFIKNGSAQLHVGTTEEEQKIEQEHRNSHSYTVLDMHELSNGNFLLLAEEEDKTKSMPTEGPIMVRRISAKGKVENTTYWKERNFFNHNNSPFANIRMVEDQNGQLHVIYSVTEEKSILAMNADNSAKIQIVRLNEQGEREQTTMLWANKDHKQKAPMFDTMFKISDSEAILTNKNGEIFKITF